MNLYIGVNEVEGLRWAYPGVPTEVFSIAKEIIQKKGAVLIVADVDNPSEILHVFRTVEELEKFVNP